MIADLYDFDKTVYMGESGTDFYLFCLSKKPSLLKLIPRQISTAIHFLIKKDITTEQMKDAMYSPLQEIDGEKMIELFWEKYQKKICKWFRPKSHDVATIVCSASPLFQIKPICDKLGVDLIIATDIDIHTGKTSGKNCRCEEKVVRIKQEAQQYEIRDVYTDNLESDAPLLSLATRNKFHAQKGKLTKI